MMANVQLLGFKCTSFIVLDLLPTPLKPTIPRPRPPETTPDTPWNLLQPFHGPPSGPLPNPPCSPLRTLPRNLSRPTWNPPYLSPEPLWPTSRPHRLHPTCTYRPSPTQTSPISQKPWGNLLFLVFIYPVWPLISTTSSSSPPRLPRPYRPIPNSFCRASIVSRRISRPNKPGHSSVEMYLSFT